MAKAQRCCKECGKALEAIKANAPHQRFCSAICRKAFNNRRMTRGAVLYDLFMGVRYERAAHAGDLALMSTIARMWHDEDEITREGRKTWLSQGDARDVLTEVASSSDKAIRDFKAAQNT